MCIIDKVKGDAKKGLFFARKSLNNNWGRAVLLNFLSTDLYERQGAAQTNFALTIPAQESDLAQDLLKSPYDFTFLPGKEKYQEDELKDALIDHITRFLVELGKGFSYVGKEYRLVAGGKEKFIDLLFYIIPLHRYCVIEVKVTEFDFPDLGQSPDGNLRIRGCPRATPGRFEKRPPLSGRNRARLNEQIAPPFPEINISSTFLRSGAVEDMEKYLM